MTKTRCGTVVQLLSTDSILFFDAGHGSGASKSPRLVCELRARGAFGDSGRISRISPRCELAVLVCLGWLSNRVVDIGLCSSNA